MGEGKATKAIEILKTGLDFLQRLVRSPSPLKPLPLLDPTQLAGGRLFILIDRDRCTRGSGVGEEDFKSLLGNTHTEIANVLQDLRSYRDLEQYMCAPFMPRKWTEVQVLDEARTAGFDGVESALVDFLNGHGGQAGSLWASFLASHAQAHCEPATSDTHNSRPGPIRLCLGGTKAAAGWTIVNALPLPGVDVVCDAGDLRTWADGSVEEVLSSSHTPHRRTHVHARTCTCKTKTRSCSPLALSAELRRRS
jgi:hypothetical protein